MRTILIWSLAIVALAIAGTVAGRPITQFLDRFSKISISSVPVTAILYEGGGLRIGEEILTFSGLDNLRRDIGLNIDASNHVVLTDSGRSFVLGPQTTPKEPRPPGWPDIDFIPDPGDHATLTIQRSLLGWLTPFEFNIIGPATSSRRRNFYYHLSWKKRSQASLDMLWRYEQRHFARGGWDKPVMRFDYHSGLVRIDIQEATPLHETAVVQYITRTKNWKRTQYRIEPRSSSPDLTTDRVAIIYLEDESSPNPGAGKSIELYVDRTTGQVTKERRFQ